MRRRQLILVHLFFLIGFLLIFVASPYYSNYKTENLDTWENKRVYTKSLNFSSVQQYLLLNSTPLDWYSYIDVNLTCPQPVYVVVQDSIGLYVKSYFGKDLVTISYYVFAPDNFTVTAESFGGMADSLVTVYPSIIIRDQPYIIWGQIMNYAGIVLIVASTVSILRYWVGRRQLPPKKLTKDTAADKKQEKRH